jgi:hypothetical protein
MCWRTKLQEQVTLAVEYGFKEVYVSLPISDATQLLEDQHVTVLPAPLVDGSPGSATRSGDVVVLLG